MLAGALRLFGAAALRPRPPPGMSDHVSWGLYISNFTFLVGLAAAAMMLVLPAYVLEDVDFGQRRADGRGRRRRRAAHVPRRSSSWTSGIRPAAWHLMPGIGYLNWPRSLLAWDVLVLNGYLAINLAIPFYILYSHFSGRSPDKSKYLPWMYVSVMWAVSIHLVTAFLLAGLPARPFWNTALLGPRFLASAFTAGPAFVIVLLSVHPEQDGVPDQRWGLPEAGDHRDGRRADQSRDADLGAVLQVLLAHPSRHQRALSLLRHRRAPGARAVDLDRDRAQRDRDRRSHDPSAAPEPEAGSCRRAWCSSRASGWRRGWGS